MTCWSGCICWTLPWQAIPSVEPAWTLQATVDDLCICFHKAKRKYYPSRQRFTLPPADGAKRGTPLVSGKLLKDYDLQGGSVLVFKDLGPQVCFTPACKIHWQAWCLDPALQRCRSASPDAGNMSWGLRMTCAPQVGWTTVFFWEYFGPLLTYAFIYFFPQYIYFGHRYINLCWELKCQCKWFHFVHYLGHDCERTIVVLRAHQ